MAEFGRQPRTGGASAPTSPGDLLELVRRGPATTRADLVALTGLARSTVSHRVDELIAEGLLYEAGGGSSTGGRPPVRLAFNVAAGLVLSANLGVTHSRFAVHDLGHEILAWRGADLAIERGPEAVLGETLEVFHALLEEIGESPDDVWGVGLGLPGPVEFATGTAVNPPLMPGWDGFAVPALIQQRFPVPVLVDNDANIMAAGEYWVEWRDVVGSLLFVKVGTGIGAGIVVSGDILRGAQGAAGDIGHVQLTGSDHAACRCGNWGCVEAVAGGRALSRRLSDQGTPARDTREVVELVHRSDVTAARFVRDAGRALGEVLAGVVNFFNPAVIVIGGDLAAADQPLLAGIREVVYQRSTSLGTRHLQLVRSRLVDDAGITGAAVLVIEHLLKPAMVDQRIGVGTADRARVTTGSRSERTSP
jgi:predicted NBD/HSP70 family sugar kinase